MEIKERLKEVFGEKWKLMTFLTLLPFILVVAMAASHLIPK